MTLITGKAFKRLTGRSSGRPYSRRGFSFIEVMVTVVILSAGLVAIYRAFFIGVNYLDHLACRLCALDLVDARVAVIERSFRANQDVEVGPLTQNVLLNGRPVVFQYDIRLKPVGKLLSVFQLDIDLTWQERGRAITVSRSAYFSGLASLKPAEGG